MEIYKYTSLSSAISILKSGGVVLNNPKNFNDPNDSSFVQSKKDKKRIEKLKNDYFVYKVLGELTSQNKVKLNKTSRCILGGLQKEIKAMNWLLKKRPYFDRIFGFNLISRIIEINSPEIKSKLKKEKEQFETDVDNAIETTKDNALVSCFSKRKESILMWSHYADSHRGVCIEYERPLFKEFKEVIYRKRRPFAKVYKAVSHAIGLDILGKKIKFEDLEKDLKETLKPFFIKSSDWAYEREVRCLYTKENLNEKVRFLDGKYILDIGRPKRIYIGCKASGLELDELIEMARRRDIEVIFMRKSLDTFNIIEDRNYKYIPFIFKSSREITIERLINDINKCINCNLFLSAFISALVIPGICSKVECQNINDSKDRYIQWCDTYLPCTDKTLRKDNMPIITGSTLWDLKEKLLSEGDINIFDNNEYLPLKRLLLRIEKRKHFDIYFDTISEDSITLNVTKLCVDMIHQAERCLELHKKEMYHLSQLPIEDYDALIDKFLESAVEMETLKRKYLGDNKSN